MRITSEWPDRAVLSEIGERLRRRRIDAGLTQARLAEEAGISKSTVERIEAGNSIDFVLLLRHLRALQLLEALDQAVPDLPQGPLALLKSQGRVRKRVGRSPRPKEPIPSPKAAPWAWRE